MCETLHIYGALFVQLSGVGRLGIGAGKMCQKKSENKGEYHL
jgi:hypothetical protein